MYMYTHAYILYDVGGEAQKMLEIYNSIYPTVMPPS